MISVTVLLFCLSVFFPSESKNLCKIPCEQYELFKQYHSGLNQDIKSTLLSGKIRTGLNRNEESQKEERQVERNKGVIETNGKPTELRARADNCGMILSTCVRDSDCCTGYCQPMLGHCLFNPFHQGESNECRPNNQECLFNYQCCSAMCDAVTGKCLDEMVTLHPPFAATSHLTCSLDAGSCQVNDHCCSNICNATSGSCVGNTYEEGAKRIFNQSGTLKPLKTIPEKVIEREKIVTTEVIEKSSSGDVKKVDIERRSFEEDVIETSSDGGGKTITSSVKFEPVANYRIKSSNDIEKLLESDGKKHVRISSSFQPYSPTHQESKGNTTSIHNSVVTSHSSIHKDIRQKPLIEQQPVSLLHLSGHERVEKQSLSQETSASSHSPSPKAIRTQNSSELQSVVTSYSSNQKGFGEQSSSGQSLNLSHSFTPLETSKQSSSVPKSVVISQSSTHKGIREQSSADHSTASFNAASSRDIGETSSSTRSFASSLNTSLQRVRGNSSSLHHPAVISHSSTHKTVGEQFSSGQVVPSAQSTTSLIIKNQSSSFNHPIVTYHSSTNQSSDSPTHEKIGNISYSKHQSVVSTHYINGSAVSDQRRETLSKKLKNNTVNSTMDQQFHGAYLTPLNNSETTAISTKFKTPKNDQNVNLQGLNKTDVASIQSPQIKNNSSAITTSEERLNGTIFEKCLANGHRCAENEDCCSKICNMDSNTCSAFDNSTTQQIRSPLINQTCLINLSTCTKSTDCCSQHCNFLSLCAELTSSINASSKGEYCQKKEQILTPLEIRLEDTAYALISIYFFASVVLIFK